MQNYYNKGTKYLEQGHYLKALQFYRKQLKDVEFKELYLNMGNCYRALNQEEKAKQCYLKSNSSDISLVDGSYLKENEYTLALNNLGLLCYSEGNDAHAIEYYRAALTLNPLYYDAIWNYSNSKLRSAIASTAASNSTDWLLGWRMYEYRFLRGSNPIKMPQPRLDCTLDPAKLPRQVNVVGEQGLGDKIMFARYIQELAKFTAVHVVAAPELAIFFPHATNCSTTLVDGPSIPLCSLAGVFGIGDKAYLSSISPGNSISLIQNGKLNIGVSWAGSPTHANNHNRSCPKHIFSDLASCGNVYNLNPAFTGAKGITDVNSKDWATTIAYVSAMDIIVSVDTSLVHLAGSLGKPVIMLQPLKDTDFRWGYGGEAIWYDNFSIVPNTGWEQTMERVISCIK